MLAGTQLINQLMNRSLEVDTAKFLLFRSITVGELKYIGGGSSDLLVRSVAIYCVNHMDNSTYQTRDYRTKDMTSERREFTPMFLEVLLCLFSLWFD